MSDNRTIIAAGTITDQKPGTWWRSLRGRTSVRCPLCKNVGGLGDHAINEKGEVHPSLDCMNDDCLFHKYVTLEGWKNE